MQERLYRTRDDKVIGGVAGGLGRYLNLDPVLIRILFVIFSFFNGLGILLYIILWIVVPEDESPEFAASASSGSEKSSSTSANADDEKNEENESETTQQTIREQPPKQNSGRGKNVIGIILIGLGFLFLLDRFFGSIDFYDIFPFVMIILGISLLWNSYKK